MSDAAEHKQGIAPDRCALAAPAVALFYAGILVGVSFIATPAKFLAQSITQAEALDVGRATFRVFGGIECFFGLLLVVLACRIPGTRARWLAAVLLALILTQLFGLRPLLDVRLRQILEGGEPPPSPLHSLYVAIEVAKLFMLVAFAWFNRPMRTHLEPA